MFHHFFMGALDVSVLHRSLVGRMFLSTHGAAHRVALNGTTQSISIICHVSTRRAAHQALPYVLP